MTDGRPVGGPPPDQGRPDGDPPRAEERPAGVPPPGEDAHEGLYVVGQPLPEPADVRDRGIAVGAVVSAVAAVVFAVGLLARAPVTLYGTALAVALFAFGVSLRRYFLAAYPDVDALEPRSPPETGPGEEPDRVSEVTAVSRRGVVGWLLAAAAGLFGLGLAAPVASLGPRVGDELRHTHWEVGSRLVTGGGDPVRPEDIAAGGVLTVWPQEAVGEERSAAILLRLGRRALPPTIVEWVVGDGLVAYSKICTHAGCPVGLFREGDDVLFCPCHQATFDAARAAEPTFGPAARPLPQLPLGVDADGFLAARGDFEEPVGPAYGWLPRVEPEEEG